MVQTPVNKFLSLVYQLSIDICKLGTHKNKGFTALSGEDHKIRLVRNIHIPSHLPFPSNIEI